MSEHYPGYDVLAKRAGLSWNDETRRVIDKRLAIPREPRFFDVEAWQTLEAVCTRIVPQPIDRPPVPLASYVDDKMLSDAHDGYRHAELPEQRVAWTRGLAALREAAQAQHGQPFHALTGDAQDALLKALEAGSLEAAALDGMPGPSFFNNRLIPDIVSAYYAHPTAWSEIGYGGPASPRGYVRLRLDRRDPWEAAEATPGHEERARRENARVG
ncbi:gluconate 2-dehydrogenase subunit 3 family protein [Lichenicoccus sp.]|uniref:gluconate 2-dehydrogenase subunit 3 family protein n=1 Tax=Lichenicoccus sp. TaxID=2781899 RepID=UPI003D09D091